MSMDAATVRKTAKLARIRLSEEEITHFTAELSGIFKWIEQLQSVNTDGVEAMTSVVAMTLPQRDDVVNDGGIQERVIANAPKAEYGCFAVPKVIE